MSDHQKTPLIPSLLALAVVLFSLLICIVSSTYFLKTTHLIRDIPYPGYDFKDFYQAASNLHAGKQLYEIERFVTPPFSAYIFLPFLGLNLEQAFKSFVVCNLIFVLIGLYLAAQCLLREAKREHFLILCFFTCLSFPFIFLLQRGNIDGIVFLFLMLSIYFWHRHGALAGSLLSIAVSLKVYPILILIGAIIENRSRVIASFLLTQTFIILIDFEAWRSYLLERIFTRMDLLLFNNNLSFASAHYFLREIVLRLFGYSAPYHYEKLYAQTLGAITFVLLVGLTAYTHFKLQRKENNTHHNMLLLYLPLMVGFPQQVFPYSHIICAPLALLLYDLWQKSVTKAEQTRIIWMSILLGLSFIFSESISDLYNSKLVFGIPAIANLCFIVLIHMHLLRSVRTKDI
jgi:uncharacterized membrane protein